MSKNKSKTCLILSILFFLSILLIVVLSQWTTSLPKFNLAGFSSDELFKAGQQKIKEGDLITAQKYLTAAYDKDSTNIRYLGELATIKYKLEDYQGALKEYDKILKTGEYNGFALNGIANIYRDQAEKTKDQTTKQEYINKAADTYKDGIKIDEKYVALYQNYAILLISIDKSQEAKKILQNGIKVTDNAQLKETLANIK